MGFTFDVAFTFKYVIVIIFYIPHLLLIELTFNMDLSIKYENHISICDLCCI